jgi:cell division protein FtsZ
MNIKIIGIGGGGCNALNYLIPAQKIKADFIALNTEHRSIRRSKAKNKILLGAKSLNGLGSGGNTALVQWATWESSDAIRNLLGKADLVCLLAGLGGGTGTGAAPVVAKIARDQGLPVAALVTLPFSHEGPMRRELALKGLQQLQDHCNLVFKLPNDQIHPLVDRLHLDLRGAFSWVDEWFCRSAMAAGDLLFYQRELGPKPSEWKTLIEPGKSRWLSSGSASGKNRFLTVCDEALKFPILQEIHFSEADNWFPLIVCKDITLGQFNDILAQVQAKAPKNVEINAGLAYDKSMKKDEIRLSLWATGPTPSAKYRKGK